MKNFWDYLEEAKPYLECCSAGSTPDEEKTVVKRIVENYDLENMFNAKANEDVLWQELAKEGVFYYVDVVKPSLYASKVNPELKLLVDTNTLHAFMHM